jgi:UDP-N-acetylmuramate: L-alanyl-gamma-D-glutamyl-meso-diaminopimelate ligase
MRIHLIGVSSTGMTQLGALLSELGHEVSGSDVAIEQPRAAVLETRPMRRLVGFDARHLDPDPDLVVIGSACHPDNPEVRVALERGLPFTDLFGALNQCVLKRSSALVVAGTAGKTLSAAFAAWLLEAAELRPGFSIGGTPKNFGRSWRIPSSPRLPLAAGGPTRCPFVLEADEYEGAFFDKLPPVAALKADRLLLTALDPQDLDSGFEAYAEALEQLVQQSGRSVLVFANAADRELVRLMQRHADVPVTWYALHDDDTSGVAPEWSAAIAASDERVTSFDLYAGGVLCGRYAVALHGRRQIRAAVGSLAAVVAGYGADLRRVAACLPRFAGIEHRQQLVGQPGGVFVYADSTRHARGIREALLTLRLRHPEARVVAVYEPRAVDAARVPRFASSLGAADHVLCAELRENSNQVSAWIEPLRSELSRLPAPVETVRGSDATRNRVLELVRPGDAVLVLSQGAFGGIHAQLLEALAGSG